MSADGKVEAGRPSWFWWVLGDLAAVGMIITAWWQSSPMLALSGGLLLFRHVVTLVTATQRKRESARINALLDEAFAENPEARPDFTLRGTLGSPGFDLVFKNPEAIRQAEQDGSLEQVMDRATSLYGMHVVLDVKST
ncbi:MAG: hypothetical protein EOP88_07750 [Verrucomicrobiaceae bacterium]|nr:MAG: hypothetical protein EOP88_07750 [Verrucomicrobiaceae bacterium]